MVKDRFLKFLGLCMKSGKLLSGDYNVEKSIQKNKVRLLILSEDASEEKVHKYTKLSNEYQIQLITCFTKAELGHAIGKSSIAIIGITDENQKKKILSLYEAL